MSYIYIYHEYKRDRNRSLTYSWEKDTETHLFKDPDTDIFKDTETDFLRKGSRPQWSTYLEKALLNEGLQRV